VFVTFRYLYASILFADKAGAYPLQVLSVNIRLEGERLTVTNTTAYYDAELITTVKKFILQVQLKRQTQLNCDNTLAEANTIKLFTVVYNTVAQ